MYVCSCFSPISGHGVKGMKEVGWHALNTLVKGGVLDCFVVLRLLERKKGEEPYFAFNLASRYIGVICRLI